MLLSIYQLGGWGQVSPLARYWVIGGWDELDHIEDQMKSRHGEGKLELVGVFPYSALDDVWAEVAMTEFSGGSCGTNVCSVQEDSIAHMILGGRGLALIVVLSHIVLCFGQCRLCLL